MKSNNRIGHCRNSLNGVGRQHLSYGILGSLWEKCGGQLLGYSRLPGFSAAEASENFFDGRIG